MKEVARIGLVGAGWWACQFHIPNLLENKNVELVAISRLGTVELRDIQSRFNIEHGSENHSEIYKYDLDGVVVASPHVDHAEHSRVALENDCHVLVEKPMTTNIDDAKLIAKLAGQKSKNVMTPYGLNYTHYMEQAADWFKARKAGEIKHVVLHMSSALMDLFGGEPMLETENHLYRPPPSTWADPQRAGGYGWGQLSHALAALFFVSELEPKSVRALCGKSTTGVDYYDAAVVDFHCGATAVISGAAGLPKGKPPQLDLKIYGTEGMFILDVEFGRERMILNRFDSTDLNHQIDKGGGFGAYSTKEAIKRFVEICRGNGVRNCGNEIVGLKTVQVLSAMYRSFESGAIEDC